MITCKSTVYRPPQSKERRGRLLTRLRALGTPAILVSHEPDVLSACDRVYTFEGIPLRLRGER